MAQPKKADVIAKLTELKIEHDPEATVATLIALAPEGTEFGASKKTDATKARVLAKSGQHIRTYDLETHGEDFEALANEFSAHTPDSTVVVE